MKQLLCSLILLSFIACNNNDKKTTKTDNDTTATTETKEKVINRSVIGKWKPVDASMTNMSEDEKNQLLNDATIEFTSDGKFISTMKENVTNGTYMHSEQDNKLSTSTESGKQETFTIEWNGDLLKLASPEGSVTMKRL